MEYDEVAQCSEVVLLQNPGFHKLIVQFIVWRSKSCQVLRYITSIAIDNASHSYVETFIDIN